MSVTLRPARREDFLELVGEAPAYRARCQTIECEGRPIAVGGLVYRPGGVFASVQLTEEARRHPHALHRAVLRGLADARRRGVREIFAFAQGDNAAAAPWLERLGFRKMSTHAGPIWVWRPREQ